VHLSRTGKSAILGLVLLAALGLTIHPGPVKAAQPASSDIPKISDARLEKARTVVYYFHGNVRCYSCKKIEAYTREAIQSGFPEELKNGSLELKTINVEESAHEHFVQDFQLYTRSVVLERRLNDKQQQWKNLEKVWSLTRNKAAFMEYVQQETLAMMNPA
jgi:hypothetical protein